MADNTIPGNSAELPEFDEKLRQCCTQSQIVSGLVDAELYNQTCTILRKPRGSWTDADRRKLKAMLDSLYS